MRMADIRSGIRERMKAKGIVPKYKYESGYMFYKRYTDKDIAKALKVIAYICENNWCCDCPLKYDDGHCFEGEICSLGDEDMMNEVIERLMSK